MGVFHIRGGVGVFNFSRRRGWCERWGEQLGDFISQGSDTASMEAPLRKAKAQQIWVVVKIMVPFWVPIILRHLILREPKKGP